MESRPRRLTEYLAICWKRKGALIFTILVMLITTYFVMRRVPNLYESRALVVITKQIQSEELQVAHAAQFAAVIQNLTSRGTLAGLIRRHKLYPQIQNFDDSIGKLRKEIKLDIKMRGYYPDGPESVSISYRYPDAMIAQKVVADLLGNFDQANVTIRQQAAGEANRMSEKIVEVEEELKKIAPQRELALMKTQWANRAANDAMTIKTTRMTVEGSVESLSDKEYALERQIADMQRLIGEQESAVKSAGAVNVPLSNPTYGALMVRKSELEALIKTYQTQYTEKNPKLATAREQLSEVNRQMERIEAGSAQLAGSTPEVAELRRMKQELSRLQTDLDVTRRDLNRKAQTLQRLPETSGGIAATTPVVEDEAAVSATRLEYDRLMTRYNWLQEKQDSLVKLAGMGSTTPLFQVVDAPYKSETPVAPNRLLLYGISLALALVIGLGAVFLLELPHFFMLQDQQDIEYYLGAPVLAMVPEALTRHERSRNRRLRMARSLIVLLSALALIPLLIILLDRSGVYQMLGSR